MPELNDDFIDYLQAVTIPLDMGGRIDSIFDFYTRVYPKEEIKDIFVSDFIDKENERRYESLWLFSDNYIIEARELLIKDNFHINITPYKNRITHLNIIGNATSLIALEFKTDTQNSCTLKGAGRNSRYLKDIFEKYIKPNLKV